MPYIVTTTRPTFPGEFDDYFPSRRAVATLDEARDSARDEVTSIPNWPRAAFEMACDLPECGGTISIGPLPDGTTIAVEKVGWAELADQGTGKRIIDAFNARQA